jgi:hypothetical protein
VAREPGDRYEPFPGLTEIPGWIWRRLGRGGRIAIGVVALALAAGTAVLIPVLSEVRRENRAEERRERAAAVAADIKRVNALQRPHTATGPRDDPRAAVIALRARILADSNSRRGLNRARRVDCTLGDRRGQVGRYSCTAVTARVINADGDRAYGITGYPYRAVVRFDTGGLTWCKVVGRAGEGSLYSRNPTPIPRACTG